MSPSICIENRIIVVLLVESIYDTKVIVCSCPLGRYWQAKKFAISADGSKTRVIKQELPPRFMERPPTRPACKVGCPLLGKQSVTLALTPTSEDRKGGVWGKRWAVREERGGER